MMIQLARGGGLPEPPWVFGDPKASYEWQVSVAGKGKKKKGEKPKPRKLEDITVEIRLKGKKQVSEGFLSKKVEEDFDPLEVAGILVRGLHHAKFKQVDMIATEDEMLVDSEDQELSFKEIIKMLEEDELKEAKQVKIAAEHRSHFKALVTIMKTHSRKKAPITIVIKGKINPEVLDRLLGYLKKHLPLESVVF